MFNKIAGYKINDAKSERMPINISIQDRERLSRLSQAKWKEIDIRYLGIKFSTSVEEMILDHVVDLLQKISQQVEVWNGLPLTWLGRVTVTKMNIVPKFLFNFF